MGGLPDAVVVGRLAAKLRTNRMGPIGISLPSETEGVSRKIEG